jgi:hypothetical protein
MLEGLRNLEIHAREGDCLASASRLDKGNHKNCTIGNLERVADGDSMLKDIAIVKLSKLLKYFEPDLILGINLTAIVESIRMVHLNSSGWDGSSRLASRKGAENRVQRGCRRGTCCSDD